MQRENRLLTYAINQSINTNKKEIGRLMQFRFLFKELSLSVSRVLSCTVIYLDLPSPISSSDINGIPSDGQPY